MLISQEKKRIFQDTDWSAGSDFIAVDLQPALAGFAAEVQTLRSPG